MNNPHDELELELRELRRDFLKLRVENEKLKVQLSAKLSPRAQIVAIIAAGLCADNEINNLDDVINSAFSVADKIERRLINEAASVKPIELIPGVEY